MIVENRRLWYSLLIMNREHVLSKPLVRAENLVNLEVERPEIPIAVDLGERAVALEAIMAYLNKANQVRGSRVQLDNGGGKLKKQYGEEHARVVQHGAQQNRDQLIAGFREGISTLAAEDALRASGMDEADVEVQVLSLQAAINRRFGVGNANAAERAKAVSQAKKLAGK